MAIFLIQEDEIEFANQLSLALSTKSHQSVICFDSSQSLDYLNEHHVDAVITDIFVREADQMKPKGGIYLLGQLQKARLTQQAIGNLPVMAITGAVGFNGSIDTLEQAMAMGAVCSLRKPFSMREFLEAAESLLRPTSAVFSL